MKFSFGGIFGGGKNERPLTDGARHIANPDRHGQEINLSPEELRERRKALLAENNPENAETIRFIENKLDNAGEPYENRPN